jgi:hypothetical protein
LPGFPAPAPAPLGLPRAPVEGLRRKSSSSEPCTHDIDGTRTTWGYDRDMHMYKSTCLPSMHPGGSCLVTGIAPVVI